MDAAAALPTNVKTTIASRLDVLPRRHARCFSMPRSSARCSGAELWGRWPTGRIHPPRGCARSAGIPRFHPPGAHQPDRGRPRVHLQAHADSRSGLHHAAQRLGATATPRWLGSSPTPQANGWPRWRRCWPITGGRLARTTGRESLIMAAEHAAHGWAKGEAVKLYKQALELVRRTRPTSAARSTFGRPRRWSCWRPAPRHLDPGRPAAGAGWP